MPDTPPHDWFHPRLTALVAQAAQAGYPQDVAVAVITDLINGPLFSAPTPIDEAWNQDPGEPQAASNAPSGQALPVRGGAEGGLEHLPGIVHGKPLHHFGPPGFKRI